MRLNKALVSLETVCEKADVLELKALITEHAVPLHLRVRNRQRQAGNQLVP